MGVLDDLIKIEQNGIVSYAGWVEWKHIPGWMIRPKGEITNNTPLAD